MDANFYIIFMKNYKNLIILLENTLKHYGKQLESKDVFKTIKYSEFLLINI